MPYEKDVLLFRGEAKVRVCCCWAYGEENWYESEFIMTPDHGLNT